MGVLQAVKSGRPPAGASGQVTIRFDGRVYQAGYAVAGEVVSLDSPHGAARAHLSPLMGPPEALAELLLMGLVQAWRHGRRSAA